MDDYEDQSLEMYQRDTEEDPIFEDCPGYPW